MFNSTHIQSNIDFDFTERIYDVHYYGFKDIFVNLGGIKELLVHLFTYFIPFFTLSFLYDISGIIDKKMEENQQ